jgi:hypothetical protein
VLAVAKILKAHAILTISYSCQRFQPPNLQAKPMQTSLIVTRLARIRQDVHEARCTEIAAAVRDAPKYIFGERVI